MIMINMQWRIIIYRHKCHIYECTCIHVYLVYVCWTNIYCQCLLFVIVLIIYYIIDIAITITPIMIFNPWVPAYKDRKLHISSFEEPCHFDYAHQKPGNVMATWAVQPQDFWDHNANTSWGRNIKAWISNYFYSFLRNAITHPCLNFNGGLSKPPLKLGMIEWLHHIVSWRFIYLSMRWTWLAVDKRGPCNTTLKNTVPNIKYIRCDYLSEQVLLPHPNQSQDISDSHYSEHICACSSVTCLILSVDVFDNVAIYNTDSVSYVYL